MHLARESIDLGSGYGVGDYDGYDDDEAPLLKHISRVNDRMKVTASTAPRTAASGSDRHHLVRAVP